jgi:type I restriction enzyme, S subunit
VRGARSTTLGEVGTWGSGGTPKSTEPSYYSGNIPWIRSGDLPDGPVLEHPVSITQTGLDNSSAKWVPKGALLIALYGATIGKLGITTYPVTTNQAVAHCVPEKGITSAEYLFWYLLGARPELVASAQGGAQPNISQAILKSHSLALPSVREQDGIVTTLNSLFNLSKGAREQLSHLPRLVERCKQAVLNSVMTADENGRSWPQASLGELITDGPTNGYSPRSGDNPRGTLSLKLTATTRGVMDLSDRAVKRLNEVIPKDSKFWLRPGDILIQRANSLEYVGMVAIYDGPAQKYIYPDLMIRIRVASSAIARWIWHYCLSASGRRYFTSNATGTAGNMPKINGSTIRKMPIPLPPMDQLEALLAKVDRALEAIYALQSEAGRAQKLLDRLDRATLEKTFRGELTRV